MQIQECPKEGNYIWELITMYRADTHAENNYLNGLSNFLLRKDSQKWEKDRVLQNIKSHLMSHTVYQIGGASPP